MSFPTDGTKRLCPIWNPGPRLIVSEAIDSLSSVKLLAAERSSFGTGQSIKREAAGVPKYVTTWHELPLGPSSFSSVFPAH
jgi:hypothetical protein